MLAEQLSNWCIVPYFALALAIVAFVARLGSLAVKYWLNSNFMMVIFDLGDLDAAVTCFVVIFFEFSAA